MTDVHDAALQYIANGWPVLPLWRPVDGVCQCRYKGDCKSPGKHPRNDIVPGGVHDATLDPRAVVRWPDDVNVGVALGQVAGGHMAFDVDHTPTAQALMHPNLGLTDETGVVLTGRPGAHVWFVSRGPTTSFFLKMTDGTKIGEVRGDGLYVAMPPSLAATGRYYKWQARRANDPPPQLAITSDPLAYVTELLAHVGVTPRAQTVTDTPEWGGEAITACDLPEALAKDRELTRYRQLLRGHLTVASADRSGELYSLAQTLAEVAARRGYTLSHGELGGVLKTFDLKAFNEPKYAHRANADQYYYELAAKALGRNGHKPDLDATQPQPDSPGDDPPADGPDSAADSAPVTNPPPAADYFWDEADGWLYLRAQTPRGASRKVCNFKPTILEEIEVYRGYGADTQREWHLQFTLANGRSTSFMIPAKDTTQMKLETTIGDHCSADYIVQTGMYGHLKTALGQLAMTEGGVTGNRVYGTTGWVEHGDRWLYLLPSSTGAITADGLEPSVRIDRHKLGEDLRQLIDNVASYGVGVRPPLTDEELAAAWDAFVGILQVGPTHKTVPIVMQVLAGPLASAGLDEALPLVHVLGKTGTLKTTYCLTALGLFGRFTSVPPASWTSTPMWVSLMLHGCKDLTLLVDDFKQVSARRETYALLQNYADKTTRGRGTTRQTAQSSLRPRGLLLSNGEDVWEDEGATMARTIVVDLMRGDIDIDRLDAAQATVKTGAAQLFGGAYLGWLSQQTAILDGQYLPDQQDRWQRHLRRRAGAGVHLRLLATIASLLACTAVVVRFVRDTYGPDAAKWLEGVVADALPLLLGKMDEQAEQVAELAPWQQVTTTLSAGMVAREVALWPRRGYAGGGRRLPDTPKADTGGIYFDDAGDTYVLLTKELTYSWVKRRLRRQGDDARFSWAAVVQDARSRGYQHKERMWVTWETGRRSQCNGIIAPLSALTGVTIP